MKQEVRSKDLKSGLRLKVKPKVKSEVRTEEILDLRLGARVKEQAIDK